jgi:hypothetical protein
MAVRTEVSAVRLHVTTPGTDRLRKGAAAELRHLLATGWQETGRKASNDYLTLRMERTSTITNWVTIGTGAEPRRAPRQPR